MVCWNDTTNFACRDRKGRVGERTKDSLAREWRDAGRLRTSNKQKAAVTYVVLYLLLVSLYSREPWHLVAHGKRLLIWCFVGWLPLNQLSLLLHAVVLVIFLLYTYCILCQPFKCPGLAFIVGGREMSV